jgi:putative OmpL-like beta-barrel porin-2
VRQQIARDLALLLLTADRRLESSGSTRSKIDGGEGSMKQVHRCKKPFRRIALGVAAGWLAIAGGALADEEKAPSKTIDERVSDLEKSLGALADFSLGGMLYGSYLYNFNRPDDRQNSLRSLDNEDNSLTVDLFQLQIGKKAPGGLSFSTKLDFGNTASRIGADWKGNGQFTGVTGDNGDFEIEEVYAVYAPDWARGWQVKAGKFVTLLGSEVIESPSNMNYSRSFLFGFAIPFTHTGILFTPPLGEHFSATIGVVNGWDNVADNNDGKTLLGSVGWIPSSAFSLYLNGTFGPEQTDKNNNPRGVADVVSTITLDPITISLNGDYGHEDGAALDGGTEKWYGFSGIVGLTLKDLVCIPAGLYFRGEVFKDDGGGRTGTDQTLSEVTVTAKYFVTEKLTLWTEYRHDWSNADSFAKNGTVTTIDSTTGDTVTSPQFKGSQDTVSIAASYVF